MSFDIRGFGKLNFGFLDKLSEKLRPETKPASTAAPPDGLQTRNSSSKTAGRMATLPPTLPELPKADKNWGKDTMALIDQAAAGGAKLQRNGALRRTPSGPPNMQLDGALLPGGNATELRPPLRRTKSDPTPTTVQPQQYQPSAMTSGADIHKLLNSNHPMDVGMRGAVFSEKFQDKAAWSEFTGANLRNGSVSEQLNAPASEWSTQTFQAMFVAAWANHPVEKGSFMIDLSGLSEEQLAQVKQAHQENCTSRPSSHLSGKGRSASEGFEFLNGYRELLVQMENLDGKPYLFLKAEGHTTGLEGVVQHTQSYFHKVKTGEGLMASPYLSALANANPDMVEGRAAENFGKQYQKLLKELDLDPKNKFVTTREMSDALFKATGFQPGGTHASEFVKNATNEELGQALLKYCEVAQSPVGSLVQLPGGKMSAGMLKELEDVGKSLVADGDSRHGRVYREVITSPAALDASVKQLHS